MAVKPSELQASFAAGNDSSAPPDTMAMIIDIMGAAGYDDEDAQAYLDNLGTFVEEMRANKIPVTWVTIGDRNHLYKPASASTAPRDFSELIGMGYHGLKEEDPRHKMFRDFMRKHGPKQNELVYEKRFKDTFLEPEDYTDNEKLRDLIQSDYTVPVDLPGPGDYAGHSMTDYARDKGTKKFILAGSMSTHCIVGSGLGGMKKGFETYIWQDGILSWEGDEKEVKPGITKPLWRKGEAAADPQGFHRAKLMARLDEIAANELEARGLTMANIERMRRNIIELDLPGSESAPSQDRTLEA